MQNWRQVLLLSLADRTRWSDRQLRLKLSCVCGAEVYPRLDELWTKFSKLVLVRRKAKSAKAKNEKAKLVSDNFDGHLSLIFLRCGWQRLINQVNALTTHW